MAYINFSETGTAHPLARDEREEVAAASEGFSGLEWSVIALAQRDRLATLRTPGRIATALGNLFGTTRNPRLADERLEALRRMAVLAWHHSYVVPVSELKAFLAAGFSVNQYEALQASIGQGRAQAARQRA